MFDRRVNPFAVYLIFALGLPAFFAGCGSGDRVEVYPTSGLVLFGGEPMMGGGAISFVPLDNQPGKAAGGTIDKEGKFTMSTYDPGDGSMAGKFRVVVVQSTVEEIETVGDTDIEGAEDTSAEFTVPEAKRIPYTYADTANSPLMVEVKSDGINELTLELSK
jgi:hypothetical protein